MVEVKETHAGSSPAYIAKSQVAELVDAYPKYIEIVELNYLDIPLTGSSPVLTTKIKHNHKK